MPTSLFYQGTVRFTPGSYSIVDASGLEQAGLGATGIVALIGTAVGGRPVDDGLSQSDSKIVEPSDFITISNPAGVRSAFRSGDLREAGAMCFEPSADQDIQAGAQSLVCMKVNRATRSSRTFSNANGTAYTVKSEDYGEFTNQISDSHVAGTNPNTKRITVQFEDTIEAADNIGGNDIFTLKYVEPSAGTGWDDVRSQVLSSGLRVNAGRREATLGAHVVNPATVGQVVQVVGTAANAGKTVTVYGLDTGNLPVRETINVINGIQAGVQTWNAVWGAQLSALAVTDPVTVERTSTQDILVIPAGQATQGLVLGSTMFVANGPLSLVYSAAIDSDVILWGKSATGTTQAERVTHTAAGDRYILTALSWSQIDVIVLGGAPTANFVRIGGTALQTLNTAQNTVQKAADFANARTVGSDGFVFAIVTGNLNFLMSDLDMTADAATVTNADLTLIAPVGTDIRSPANPGFRADLKAMLDFYNVSSQLVDATRITFVPRVENVTIAAAISSTLSIDGYSFTATAGTVAAFIALINKDRRVNERVTASDVSTGGAQILQITSSTPAGFVLTEADANLTVALVSSVAGVGAPPSNTSAPEFLTGGGEGTATFQQWQDALNLLKKVRVNTIVPLTGDPAVHAALDAHCAFMAGLGRNERDGLVGLSALDGNSAPTNVLPTKTSAKAQAADLNTRHLRACAQSITRFNTAGERTVFLPWFQATIGAGMQAGASVGTPLTYKFANVLDIAQDATWNPVDDSEEMIQAGIFFMERIDGAGRRWVRNVTTWLKTNTIAVSEASVNQAVIFAVYEFRTAMEIAVGRKGFAGTVNAAKTRAQGKLGALIDSGAITDWRALSIELVVDVLQVSVEMAPVIPINFVLSTVHLVTVRQAA